MRRIGIILIGLSVSLMAFTQVRDIDMSEMRARRAVDTLVLNDLYLESGGTVNYTDSTANFRIIDVDSTITTVLDYEPPHGMLAFADSTATLDLTQNTWAKITNPNNDLYTIVDDDGITIIGDSITIITPGDYMIWVFMSFNGNAQDVYHCAVYKNGVVTSMEMHRKTSNNDTGNMSMAGIFDNLIAGDDFSLYIQNTANSNDPVFISSQIIILMIHPR